MHGRGVAGAKLRLRCARRLKQATNPENGAVGYFYDDGEICSTRTDNDGTIVSMSFDALSRLKSKSYSGPRTAKAVTWCYDGLVWNGTVCGTASPAIANAKGRLTEVVTDSSSTRFVEFDAVGRVRGSRQTTGGTPYNLSYTWTPAGQMWTETLHSSRVVSYGFDDLGRPNSASWAKGSEVGRTASVRSLPRMEPSRNSPSATGWWSNGRGAGRGSRRGG